MVLGKGRRIEREMLKTIVNLFTTEQGDTRLGDAAYFPPCFQHNPRSWAAVYLHPSREHVVLDEIVFFGGG